MPSSGTEEARPRVMAPGVLSVVVEGGTTRGLIRIGPLAGHFDEEADVTDWKGAVSFVPRADLTADVIAKSDVLLPETWIAKDQTRLQRLAALVPIVCVDEETANRLRKTGARIITVGFTRNADDYFHFSIDQNGIHSRLVTGSLLELERACGVMGATDDQEKSLRRRHHVPHLAGRILRAASEGLVSENTIALACYLFDRGGESDAEEEQILSEVEEYANAFVTEGAAIALAISEAGAASDKLEVPIYGPIHRTRLKTITLQNRAPEGVSANEFLARVEIRREDGGLERSLVLPAVDEWHVEDVEPWKPRTTVRRQQQYQRQLTRHALRPTRTSKSVYWILSHGRSLLFVALALVIGCVLLRVRCR